MRILFPILLFFAFALRPAMEISTVLYYQLNIDYIVENYCVNKERPTLKCDGKCYLAKQMESINTSGDTENDERIGIIGSFIPLFYQENPLYDVETLNTSIKTSNWFFREDNTLEISYEIDHPPKIA